MDSNWIPPKSVTVKIIPIKPSGTSPPKINFMMAYIRYDRLTTIDKIPSLEISFTGNH